MSRTGVYRPEHWKWGRQACVAVVPWSGYRAPLASLDSFLLLWNHAQEHLVPENQREELESEVAFEAAPVQNLCDVCW